ncbi:MAG: hypothetical protein FJX76_00605 [Armatimonadetes bacterium]|nr:hypothetical protein [Armatimonadota bacterium]
MQALNNLTQTANSLATGSAKVQKNGNEMDFMQFLVAQLKNQSPLNPQNSDSMMQQMAMMQMVSETRQLRTELKDWAQAQGLAGASNLVGRTAKVLNNDGQPMMGQVEAVAIRDGRVSVRMAGLEYPLSKIYDVQ